MTWFSSSKPVSIYLIFRFVYYCDYPPSHLNSHSSFSSLTPILLSTFLFPGFSSFFHSYSSLFACSTASHPSTHHRDYNYNYLQTFYLLLSCLVSRFTRLSTKFQLPILSYILTVYLDSPLGLDNYSLAFCSPVLHLPALR